MVGFHIVEGFPLPNAMPTDDGNVYTFDVSSFDKISSTPMLRDPYEAICVACKKSKVSFWSLQILLLWLALVGSLSIS